MPETASETDRSTDARLAEWQAGVVAGILGGIAMAVLYSLFQPSFLRASVPALYGLDGASGLVGWTLHVLHAAVLGVVFAAGFDAIEGGDWPLVETTVASVAFALVIWAFVALLVDPIWAWNPGTPPSASPVDVSLVGVVAHVAFGLVVGPVAAYLR